MLVGPPDGRRQSADLSRKGIAAFISIYITYFKAARPADEGQHASDVDIWPCFHFAYQEVAFIFAIERSH